jgi:aminoglycoside 6'-N-acetyltransferase I
MRAREAQEGDIAEWVRMRRELWPDCPEDHEPEVREYFAGRARTVVIAFVLERENGELGGFIEINERNYAEGCSSLPVPYIEGWYVDPDLRGGGFGRLLVTCVEDWARAEGFDEIASDCRTDNALSIKVHEALGFVEVERTVCFIKRL